MEQKFNIAELLKDCPKGMELDCTLWDSEAKVFLERVLDDNFAYPIEVTVKYNNIEDSKSFTKYGAFNNLPYGKCVIFPKGKTTWEGFERPFKDGDVIVGNNGVCRYITIFKEFRDNISFRNYVSFTSFGYFKVNDYCDNANLRFATEEEQEKLFKEIKDRGYKWNPETKTLEKLCPFNAGDVLVSSISGDIILFSHIDNEQVIHHHCILNAWNNFYIVEGTSYGAGMVHNCKLATEEQRDRLFDRLQKSGYKYNSQTNKLEKLVKPQFKVGDRITNGKISITIGYIDDEYYYEFGGNIANRIFIKNQTDWKLVTNKFDISTLKPFDKVLVRYCDNAWQIQFFEKYDKRLACPFVCMSNNYKQCIPYEGNEHLLDTTNKCDDFYKNWE